jgi:hypothetical protein
MGVIRHEAVRHNFKPFVPAGTPKVLQCLRNRGGICKEGSTLERAKREEIAVKASVVEARNPWRA